MQNLICGVPWEVTTAISAFFAVVRYHRFIIYSHIIKSSHMYKSIPFLGSATKHGIVLLQSVTDNNVTNTDCYFYADQKQTKRT